MMWDICLTQEYTNKAAKSKKLLAYDSHSSSDTNFTVTRQPKAMASINVFNSVTHVIHLRSYLRERAHPSAREHESGRNMPYGVML